MQQVLVLNCGSSSIKYQVLEMKDRRALASGLVERIGEEESRLKHRSHSGDRQDEQTIEEPIADHRDGMERIGRLLADDQQFDDGRGLIGVGHRVVHGGERFSGAARIDSGVIEAIRELSSLAPLHNPANLTGIEVARAIFPDVPQVAVFDTAFHQTLPPHAYHYAIPRRLYEELGIRRYGFHGTSHLYVAKQTAAHLGRPLAELNAIIFHLGNGASATAIRGGKSVDTSMGLTPLEGLVMGTRSGDIDPAVVFHYGRTAGKSLDELDDLLNKQSGLRGLCGENDMREVLRLAESGDESARLAVGVFVHRMKKYLGAYYAVLGRVDAVVFTAGIGENAAEVRAAACRGLEELGITIDGEKNEARRRGLIEIQAENSRVRVLVVPTNEELEIAEHTVACVADGSVQ